MPMTVTITSSGGIDDDDVSGDGGYKGCHEGDHGRRRHGYDGDEDDDDAAADDDGNGDAGDCYGDDADEVVIPVDDDGDDEGESFHVDDGITVGPLHVLRLIFPSSGSRSPFICGSRRHRRSRRNCLHQISSGDSPPALASLSLFSGGDAESSATTSLEHQSCAHSASGDADGYSSACRSHIQGSGKVGA